MKPAILTVGLNHTSAPVEIREQATSATCLRGETRDSLLHGLDPAVLPETLVLSTCNRTEIYAVALDPERGGQLLRSAFGVHDRYLPNLPEYLYIYSERAAVRHLFRVTCGLDSMLVGEFEILGQVRLAYSAATEEKTIGPVLHHLMQQAVAVGKRARTETSIGAGATSVAYAAVALARQHFGDLRGRMALVIGAGEMGRRAARNLAEDGACTVVVTSRTLEHARKVAEETRGGAVPFSELGSVLAQADLVISATKAPHIVLDCRSVAEAMRARPDKPLCLVDIAVPRDIDPAVITIPNVTLQNVDDLEGLVAANRQARAAAIADVEIIITQELDSFWEWHMSRRAAPVLSELDARAEAIRRSELERTLKRLEHLDARDRQAIAAMSAGIVKKLLAAPRTQIKTRMQGGDGQSYLDFLSELFELDTPPLP